MVRSAPLVFPILGLELKDARNFYNLSYSEVACFQPAASHPAFLGHAYIAIWEWINTVIPKETLKTRTFFIVPSAHAASKHITMNNHPAEENLTEPAIIFTLYVIDQEFPLLQEDTAAFRKQGIDASQLATVQVKKATSFCLIMTNYFSLTTPLC